MIPQQPCSWVPLLVPEVNAEHLRQLIQHDNNTNTCFKPDQHRFGDEVCDKAHPEQRSQYEEASDH